MLPTQAPSPEVAQQAEALYREGEFARAASAFLEAADAQHSRANYYRLRAAESWREEGNLDAAREITRAIKARRLEETEQVRLELLLAELALADGGDRSAADWLARPRDQIPEAYRARYHELRARALTASDPFSAATDLAWLQALLPPAERNENTHRIEGLLAKLPDAELSLRTSQLAHGHPLYAFAGRVLVRRGLPLPRAFDRATTARSAARPPVDSDGYRPPNQVGLLLPDEGPLAAAAQSVRDGFFTAYYSETRRRPRLIVYKSGITGKSAYEAYRRAVAAGADLVVGPLSRDSVTELFAQSELPVPLLTLNRGAGNPPPPGSFSFALAPEDEAIAIAEHLHDQGAHRVIAFAGDDESSQRSLAAFRGHWQAHGGQVAGAATLPEHEPNYGPAIRNALEAAQRSATQSPSSEQADYEAIFIAARPNQARLLLPQLRGAEVTNVPLLATSSVYARDGNVRLDSELDGLIVTEVSWLVEPVPGVPSLDEISGQMTSTRGPGARLFAFGMDAFRLLGYMEKLAQQPNATLVGATGVLSLDGFGQVQREPAFAQFQGGRLRSLPALGGSGLGAR